ncbi:cytochrome P450 [Crepidotus variabilis]|uniref:Cytochrome P450 n=1 Tax=Crepidotus variabilis TaxID=179855 RepID=A0A9P6JP31_9AGAR|nr:cytochrome P450 [Crepidotus variabilis]
MVFVSTLSAIPSPSSMLLALVSLVTVLTYIFAKCVYNLFLSHLSAIPGPWYYAISDVFLLSHVVRLRQCQRVQELFEAYGPVVRVGPNKIVFRDLSTMRNVYTIHKFDKSDYYKSLLTNDNDHAMSTLDHATHTIRRKSYAPHYSHSSVAQFQPEMSEHTFELINTLENIGGKSPVECLALFRHLMVDVVTASCFGHRLGAVGRWAMGVEDPLSTAINDFPKRGILRSVVPAFAWKLVCKIPNVRWRQLCDSDKILAEFVSARVYEMRAQVNAGRIGESEKHSMLQRLLEYRYSSEVPMPDHDIISECIGHFMAGTDTTSTSITYFLWELTRRPDILKKLQLELDEAMPDSKVLPDITSLNELPYLNAFVKEGLRVYTAVPSLLERVVPSSTKTVGSDELYDMMGYGLPPGTIVSTQAWSMHRDPSVFAYPDAFIPERWLESNTNSQEDILRMSSHMMPFGSGTRICGGHTLALMMLKMATAAFVRNFEFRAPQETTPQSMEIKDSFVIFPAGFECKLTFVPRQH